VPVAVGGGVATDASASSAAAAFSRPLVTASPASALCNVPAPNVLCVGATDNRDQRWERSNVGATAAGLFAPGAYVDSTMPGATYG